MAASSLESATSKGVYLSNCENLTNLKDIDEAYDALCKEEVSFNLRHWRILEDIDILGFDTRRCP